MICALEIAMLVFGIMALANGKLTFDQKNGLRGGPAYFAGLLLLLPLPLALLAGFAIGFHYAQQGMDIEKDQWLFIVVEAGIALGVLVLVGLIFAVASGPLPDAKLKRSWRDDEEDNDRRRRDRDRDDDDRGGYGRGDGDRRGFRGEDDDYDRRRDDEDGDRPRDPRIRGGD